MHIHNLELYFGWAFNEDQALRSVVEENMVISLGRWMLVMAMLRSPGMHLIG